MAVIEQSYSSLDELHSIIQENLPGWLHAQPEETLGQYKGVPYRLKTSDESEYMDLFVASAASSFMSVKARVHSSKNNINAVVSIIDVSVSNESATSISSGIVRIIVRDKTFALMFLSTDYVLKTGGSISFVGDVSDGDFYVCFGSGYDKTTNKGGCLVNMRNINTFLVAPYHDYSEYNVLIPCCDYAHGSTEPIQGIYIPICISNPLPTVLYNGNKKYYRLTNVYQASLYTTTPFYVEADE